MLVMAPKNKTGVTPPQGKNVDPVNAAKTTHLVNDIINRNKVTDEPQAVDCYSILVSRWNRGKQPPNVVYVHKTLLANLEDQGFDPTRPHPGILVELDSPAAKQDCID